MRRLEHRTPPSAAALTALVLAACGSSSAPPGDMSQGGGSSEGGTVDGAGGAVDGGGPTGDSLVSLGLFIDPVAQVPAPGVIPYDVIAVLFADQAEKLRFLTIPAGQRATYDPTGFWEYPDSTIFVKTFFYYHDARDPSQGRRLLETRIVERKAGLWTGRTYVWNEAQTEALRLKVGETLTVEWIDSAGQMQTFGYRVPNDNECKTCHSKDHVFQPLGPRTRQLNRNHDYGSSSSTAEPQIENQIDHLVSLGLVEGDIPPAADRYTLSDPYGAEPLESRARSYLDANCSHCHRPGGEAGSSALDLRREIVDPLAIGVCRVPVAAGPGAGGHTYDIVPGNPDDSIMVFRMLSTDPELKMPEIPTMTSDADGSALIGAWIASMPPVPCR